MEEKWNLCKKGEEQSWREEEKNEEQMRENGRKESDPKNSTRSF